MAKTRSSKRADERSSSTKLNRYAPAPKLQAFAMILFPIVIGAVFIAPVALTEGVFTYILSGAEYSIGTRGYTVNGIQAILIPTFDYPTPADWPSPIPGFPKLLIAHFSVSCFLALYIVIYLTALVVCIKYPTKVDRASGRGYAPIARMARQQGYTGIGTIVAIVLVLSLSVADFTLVITSWKSASLVGGFFNATTLGSALGWVGVIFGGLWLLTTVLLWFGCFKPKKSSS